MNITNSIPVRKIAFWLISLCFIWFPLQDITISFCYRLYPSTLWKLLLVFKEMLVIAALTLLIIRKILKNDFSLSIIEIFGFLYLSLCVFYIFNSDVSMVPYITIFTIFRSFILPIIFVEVGKLLELSTEELKKLFKIIISISLISIGIGVVECIIPVDKFWNGFLNLYGYLTNIKGLQEDLAGGFIKNIPGNFWGYVGIRRMAGTFASPLALGYYLIVPLLLVFAYKFKRRSLIVIFLLIGLLLTETRAAIIAVALGFLLYYLKLRNLFSLKFSKYFILGSMLLSGFLIGAISVPKTSKFVIDTLTAREGRIIGHIESLKKSISVAPESIFIGKGFGTAGSWATLQGSKIVTGGGENVYFAMWYQISSFGAILFLGWWFLILIRMNKLYYQLKNSQWRNVVRAIICLNIVYFLTGIISEQILTFTSVAHFWILTGAILGVKNWDLTV